MIHRWANKLLLENIRFIWQILNIRFRDIFCEIFRFATETFRLRRIGYIKYYITFSKYPEYLRSKPRRKFLNETENQYKEINEIATNSTTNPAFILIHICIRCCRKNIYWVPQMTYLTFAWLSSYTSCLPSFLTTRKFFWLPCIQD